MQLPTASCPCPWSSLWPLLYIELWAVCSAFKSLSGLFPLLLFRCIHGIRWPYGPSTLQFSPRTPKYFQKYQNTLANSFLDAHLRLNKSCIILSVCWPTVDPGLYRKPAEVFSVEKRHIPDPVSILSYCMIQSELIPRERRWFCGGILRWIMKSF